MGLIQKLLTKGLTSNELIENGYEFKGYEDNRFYFTNPYLYLILEKKGMKYFFVK